MEQVSEHFFCLCELSIPEEIPDRENGIPHGKKAEFVRCRADADAVSEYGTPEMMGWTAGVYLALCKKLEK